MHQSPQEHQAVQAAAAITLSLPSYALDGRSIRWNADRTAAVFRSTSSEYHSDKRAVSASMLRQLARSPAHLQAYLGQSQSNNTAARRFGTAVHAAILETHLFASQYVVYTGGDRRGQQWDDFKARHVGVEILKPDELNKVLAAARAVLSMPVAQVQCRSYRVADLVSAGETEINYYWVDQDTGTTCKARMDLVAGDAVFDVKTTDDSRAAAFGPHASKMGYDIQAAFYLRALETFNPALRGTSKFYFLAVEDELPNAPMLHQADRDEFVKFGDQKVGKLLKAYAQCKNNGLWPAYDQPTTTLKLPFHQRYPSGLNI